MPRGRFISRSFYDNYRLNSMPIEVHHLFGGIDVVCADVEGRCKGDAKWINNQVFSLREYGDEEVEGWLNQLWESKGDETGLGLIERYDINGRPYIWIPGFDKHQKGRHKDREAESDIPSPPKELMEKARQRMVESQGQEVSKSESEIRTDDLKVAAMIKYFEDEAGRVLQPFDLVRLVDFADNYPDGWFEKAVDEAVKNNARIPMRYIEKIMENWLSEGVNPLGRSRAKAHQGQPTKPKGSRTDRLKASAER